MWFVKAISYFVLLRSLANSLAICATCLLFCISTQYTTKITFSVFQFLPVNEPNQSSKCFLVQPHGKSFQCLNVLHCSSFSFPLWGVVGRTGGTQFTFRLALATHSYGELIDNWRCKDDLRDVFLGGAEDCRSSLDCCWVGKVRLVVCTFEQIMIR